MKCVMIGAPLTCLQSCTTQAFLKLCPAGLKLQDCLLSMTCLKLSERGNEWTLDTDAAHKKVIVNCYSQEDTCGILHSAVVADSGRGDEF